MKKAVAVLIVTALAIGAIGASPRLLEELRIGGGYGSAPDGGADFEKDGDILTNGSVVIDGDIGVGSDKPTDHALSVTSGDGNTAYLNLNESDALNGGAMWFDGALDTLRLGTRNGVSAPVPALSIARGDTTLTAEGDLIVLGGDIGASGDEDLLGLAFNRLTVRGKLDAGAGGDSPKLHVYSGDSGWSGTRNFRLNDAGAVIEDDMDVVLEIQSPSNNTSEIWFADQNAETSGRVRYVHATDTMELWAGNGIRLSLTNTGNATLTGDFTASGGDIIAGADSAARGVLTAWDGSGGNAPGAIKMASPNGAVWYLFVEDDGTLKVHSALPTQNSDGVAVGTQF